MGHSISLEKMQTMTLAELVGGVEHLMMRNVFLSQEQAEGYEEEVADNERLITIYAALMCKRIREQKLI